jgi:hypothetical protein
MRPLNIASLLCFGFSLCLAKPLKRSNPISDLSSYSPFPGAHTNTTTIDLAAIPDTDSWILLWWTDLQCMGTEMSLSGLGGTDCQTFGGPLQSFMFQTDNVLLFELQLLGGECEVEIQLVLGSDTCLSLLPGATPADSFDILI